MLPSARVVGIASLDATAESAANARRADAEFNSDDGRRPSYTSDAGTSSSVNVPQDAAANDRQPIHAEASSPSTNAEQQQQSSQASEEQEPPIEELVNKVIIHSNKPIENLPLISPPELKLIGRCVTFKGDTTVEGETRSFYYEGLVATINKETVMLIHVQRYTEEDFQLHKLELRHHHNSHLSDGNGKEQEGTGSDTGGAAEDNTNGLNTGTEAERGIAATREEREARRRTNDRMPHNELNRAANTNNNNDFDFDHTAVASQTMEEPQLLNHLGETHEEATTRVRNRMRGHQGSMGPIPYVTFSRSRIHRVEFGVDPRSTFFSIFHDPSKLHFDMQCLRMFVRRYLIHTSQGNNPRMVPLRAFVTCRCNCPDLDNDLLIQTTKEELAHLIKIDRDVKRAKKRKEQGRRNVLRAYRAPNGLFRHTGVLYLTHLPRQTFTIGVMEAIVIMVVLIYEVLSSVSGDLFVIAPYVMKVYPYIFATVVVSVMATGCTLLHAVRMCLPLASQLYLVVIRGLLTFGAVACSIMTMIVAGEMANLNRWWNFYERELTKSNLCLFYASHHCSGITQSCVVAFNSSECQCPGYTSPTEYFPYTCDTQIVVYIQRTTIPLVCMSFLIFATYLFDGYLHLRLFHVARLLERRM
jgi:hypothetical protein